MRFWIHKGEFQYLLRDWVFLPKEMECCVLVSRQCSRMLCIPRVIDFIWYSRTKNCWRTYSGRKYGTFVRFRCACFIQNSFFLMTTTNGTFLEMIVIMCNITNVPVSLKKLALKSTRNDIHFFALCWFVNVYLQGRNERFYRNQFHRSNGSF